MYKFIIDKITKFPFKVAEHSFLVPMRLIYRYFQTTGSWAAKIGKVQVQLKKIVFWYVLLD